MFQKKAIITVITLGLLCNLAVADELSDNWGEFIHYAKIGRIELAQAYGQKIVDSNASPVELLKITKETPAGYDLLLKMYASSEELREVSGKILAIIEKGRYEKRTDAAIIAEEIRRLSSTSRGRLAAIERLKNSGEYAVVLMLDAMADTERKDEFANIASALPQIGRDAVRPLVVALQTDNVAVKAEIIKALGEIGYSGALAYLKYIVENDSSPEMKTYASSAISKIDEIAMGLTSAELFYSLADDYYYEKESLAVRSGYDFGNVWFWDAQGGRLTREEVDIKIFYQIMSMRCCEGALRADPNIAKAIGLWLAAFIKAESKGVAMPAFFGEKHAKAMVYAQTAGAEYLHMTLARAIKDKDAYVALNAVEALAVNAGEKSLLYRIGTEQPLVEALKFDDRAVRYSAAIAIGQAGPVANFPESSLIIENLAQALVQAEAEGFDKATAQQYSLRVVNVLLKLAVERNPVVNIIDAKDQLIAVTADERDVMKVLACQTLARLNSPDAQRTIATLALNEQLDAKVRIECFACAAVSAKMFGNLLEDSQVGQIYGLIGNEEALAEIRTAAAGAYGALNLPSDKVKDLILDKAKI